MQRHSLSLEELLASHPQSTAGFGAGFKQDLTHARLVVCCSSARLGTRRREELMNIGIRGSCSPYVDSKGSEEGTVSRTPGSEQEGPSVVAFQSS